VPSARDADRLTSGRLLLRNTLFNLGGQGATIVLALVAVPVLLHGLGPDRFGVLALAWATISYAGRLDLGLGRALTRSVSMRLGTGREDEVPAVFWAAVSTVMALGVAVAVGLAALAPWLVHDVLTVPPGLEDEAIAAFRVLSVSAPVVVGGTAIRGYLEAQQRFDLTNAILLPATLLSYLGPVVVLAFTNSLPLVVSTVVASRLVAALISLWFCLRITPALRRPTLSRPALAELVRSGGWIMSTNLVIPLLSTTLDRYFIGALVSTAAVAYYATPAEAIMRLAIIPAALTGVMFPAFSLTAASDRGRTAELFNRGERFLFLAIFPPVLVAVALASPLMTAWLGADIAERSTPILQWLAAGVLMNALAVPTFGLVQAIRPRLLTIVQVVELPFYAFGLWLLLKAFGVTGAAIAWTIRAGIDSLVLFVLAGRLVPQIAAPSRRLWAVLLGTLAGLVGALWADGLGQQVTVVLAGLALFGVAAWRLLLSEPDRALIARWRAAARRARLRRPPASEPRT
jgi:O-antigen/teichoic acid export membrane protein